MNPGCSNLDKYKQGCLLENQSVSSTLAKVGHRKFKIFLQLTGDPEGPEFPGSPSGPGEP